MYWVGYGYEYIHYNIVERYVPFVGVDGNAHQLPAHPENVETRHSVHRCINVKFKNKKLFIHAFAKQASSSKFIW